MIYLIDDDASVREALHLLLQTYDLSVSCFASPAECLAHLDRSQPGVLIMDLRMPLMSGLQLYEQLRAQGVDGPAIVITGHGDLHSCRRAFKAGVTDFLTKPLEEQTLLEAIRTAQATLARQQGNRGRAGYLRAHRGHPPRQAGRKAGHGLRGRADPAAAVCRRAQLRPTLGKTTESRPLACE